MSLKNVYNAKINNIVHKIPDITNLATNASVKTNKNEVKCEIPNITNLATNASRNIKINEAEGEISNITNLAITTTTTALTPV